MTWERAAALLVGMAEVYLAAGLVFALAFALRGAAVVDPQARGASWGFWLAILPGTAALWPLLLSRWLRRQEPPEERNAHRRAARAAAGEASDEVARGGRAALAAPAGGERALPGEARR